MQQGNYDGLPGVRLRFSIALTTRLYLYSVRDIIKIQERNFVAKKKVI